MRFKFSVGDREDHEAEVHWDQMWGPLRIYVDHDLKVRDFRLFALSLSKVYELSVGNTERYTVRIEKIKHRFFGGARRQQFTVYVDGRPQDVAPTADEPSRAH